MSRKQTSKQSDCDHISKVVKFGYKLVDGDVLSVVDLWGCTKCDLTSSEPLYDIEANKPKEKDHTNCGGPSKCFGCKAQNLAPLMNVGDAGRDLSDKKLQKGLASYRDARRQGIQPNGTHPIQVQAAFAASEKLGKAYQGDTMVRADKVTKSLAKTINEVGA